MYYLKLNLIKLIYVNIKLPEIVWDYSDLSRFYFLETLSKRITSSWARPLLDFPFANITLLDWLARKNGSWRLGWRLAELCSPCYLVFSYSLLRNWKSETMSKISAFSTFSILTYEFSSAFSMVLDINKKPSHFPKGKS